MFKSYILQLKPSNSNILVPKILSLESILNDFVKFELLVINKGYDCLAM